MTSFTKQRRQLAGKSLVRLKLKVTSLLARVWADLLRNIHVYFWSLKKWETVKTFFFFWKVKKTSINRRCFVHESFFYLNPFVLSALGRSYQVWEDLESCAAQMWVCQCAQQQLAVPATTRSVFWNMAFFSVYWFLSRPNLKRGGKGRTANHSSRRPIYCTEALWRWVWKMHAWSFTLHKSIFENSGQSEFKFLCTTIKHIYCVL